MTPRVFKKYLKVYVRKEEERAKEMDSNNFNLGKYIAYAVNDPKKYPRRPFLDKRTEVEDKMMSAEEMERMARLNTVKLGGTIK